MDTRQNAKKTQIFKVLKYIGRADIMGTDNHPFNQINKALSNPANLTKIKFYRILKITKKANYAPKK
jgi:hypothetical protein